MITPAAFAQTAIEAARVYGRTSDLTFTDQSTEQARRLVIDALCELLPADDNLRHLLRAYRSADRIASRGHSYSIEDAEGLEFAAEEIGESAQALAAEYDALADWIRGNE